nr:hypothetical protein [Arthrobacter sp. ISL-48]
MSTVRAWVAVPVFPAASVIDANTVCGPFANVAVVTAQVPPDWTGEVSVCPSTETVTVDPVMASVVPAIVGVAVSSFSPPLRRWPPPGLRYLW